MLFTPALKHADRCRNGSCRTKSGYYADWRAQLIAHKRAIGSVIGPVVVAALLVVLDYGQVAAIIGVCVAALGFVMALLSLKFNKGAAHA